MPLIQITTNRAISADNQAAFMRQLSSTTASMLGKPESYVMAVLHHQPTMLFAGTGDPTALVELKSLELPEDRSAAYSEQLCLLIQNQLEIPPERTYIEFCSPERHMWGWSSRTF